MNRNDLNKIFEETVQECREIMFAKNQEYSKDSNALDNFDNVATKVDVDVLKIWYTYFCKHLNSLETYIRDGELYSNESIDSRIFDLINYLILCRSLIIRERGLNGDYEQNIKKGQVLLENIE